MIKKVIIDQKGNKYYWKQGDLHTSLGVIKEKDIKDGIIATHLGKECICFPASWIDQLEKIQRGGPAIITKKDLGMILAHIPITKDTKILDAGTGTGLLAAFLARISDEVISYEKKEEFLNLAKKNFEFLNVNVKLKEKDIYQGIEEKELDVLTLDLPEPWLVLPHTEKSMKKGSYLVTFLPNITQVMQLVREAKNYQFYHEQTIEGIEREWHVEEKKVRPHNMILGHTGFLTFLRKY